MTLSVFEEREKLEKEIAELNQQITALTNENNILIKGLGCETCGITDTYKELNGEITKLKLQLDTADERINILSSKNTELGKQLDEEKKLNSDIKQRFVKIPSSKCDNCQALFDGICEGKDEVIDILSLIENGTADKLIYAQQEQIKELQTKLAAYEEFDKKNLEGI